MRKSTITTAKKQPIKKPVGGKKAPAAAKKSAPSKKVSKPEKEENKVELKAEPLTIIPKREPVIGESVITYNTYKSSFKHIDGQLKWEDIDDEYCFSFAFEKDNYELRLKLPDEKVYLEMQDEIFSGLIDGQTYACEVKEHPYIFKRKVKEEGDDSEEEEEEKASEQAASDENIQEIDNSMSRIHDDPTDPKNLTKLHKIVVYTDKEQTKDFLDLMDTFELGRMLNKRLKQVQSFMQPGQEKTAKRFYNTYRNGFVSAISMAYNYHMPLVLSPNDVWLAVIQGFRIHLALNHDKQHIQLSFKDIKDLSKTVKENLVIDNKIIKNVSEYDKDKFSELITQKVIEAQTKAFDGTHASPDFMAMEDAASQDLIPVNKPSDTFRYEATTNHELRKLKAKYGKRTVQDLSEEVPADEESTSKAQRDLYNTLYALGSFDSNVDFLLDLKSKQHCGIPEVHFQGTLNDWLNLRRKITYLDRYGCHKWLDVMLPVINKFILAIKTGQVDKEFWDRAYQVVPAQTETSSNKVNGWICNFFPYVGSQLREQFGHQSGMKKLFRERGSNYKTFMMDDTDFHRGIQFSTITINKKEYTLASGFIGVELQNLNKENEDLIQSVKSAVGWYLYEEDPSKPKAPNITFLAAETSGSLF